VRDTALARPRFLFPMSLRLGVPEYVTASQERDLVAAAIDALKRQRIGVHFFRMGFDADESRPPTACTAPNWAHGGPVC
jgi:hypothetical protein